MVPSGRFLTGSKKGTHHDHYHDRHGLGILDGFMDYGV